MDYTSHIEILENDEMLFNYDENNIPTTFNVSYCDITDLIDLLNSRKGYQILRLVLNDDIYLNLYAKNKLNINEYEQKFLDGHDSIFLRDNVSLFPNFIYNE
jgi:hypothetical protein